MCTHVCITHPSASYMQCVLLVACLQNAPDPLDNVVLPTDAMDEPLPKYVVSQTLPHHSSHHSHAHSFALGALYTKHLIRVGAGGVVVVALRQGGAGYHELARVCGCCASSSRPQRAPALSRLSFFKERMETWGCLGVVCACVLGGVQGECLRWWRQHGSQLARRGARVTCTRGGQTHREMSE